MIFNGNVKVSLSDARNNFEVYFLPHEVTAQIKKTEYLKQLRNKCEG